MSTEIRGTLISLGTPPDSTQPRALVHCTIDQIRAVEHAAMLRGVAVLAVEELDALKADAKRLNGIIEISATWLNREVIDQRLAEFIHKESAP